MRALIAERETARIEHMARQEMAGECKPIGYIPSDRFGVAFAQESRESKHLIGPGLAGSARDCPAGFWRHKNQFTRSAGCDTPLEIETKTEFGQKLRLEPHNQRRGKDRVVETAENFVERLVETGMRVTLGQKPHQGGEVGDAKD